MTTLYESDVEQLVIELLEKQGYSYLFPEAQETERQNLSEVVLQGRLKTAIDTLNPTIPENSKEQALREVLNLPHQTLIENNGALGICGLPGKLTAQRSARIQSPPTGLPATLQRRTATPRTELPDPMPVHRQTYPRFVQYMVASYKHLTLEKEVL